MKKYIRTKDGLYELNPPDYESLMCLDGKTITTCVYTKNQEWVAKSDILKQSDDLIELCDEFVSKNKLLSPKYIDPRESELQSWKNCFEEELIVKCNKEIWGCIWVSDDNGAPILKPVAKINNKGDFKLI